MKAPTLLFLLPLLVQAVKLDSKPRFVPHSYIVQLETGLGSSGFAKRDAIPVLTTVLAKGGIDSTVRQTFDSAPEVFHGGSIKVAAHVTMKDIAAIPGVKKVWPIRLHSSPKPVLSAEYPFIGGKAVTAEQLASTVLSKRAFKNLYLNDTFSPHTMTQVNITHSMGLLGDGVKIGIIDSGVDYTNPILGGCFGPGCHISFGYNFVGNNYNGDNFPIPGGPPLSTCNYHGTHVTGIIGALPNSYGFTGVAPAAMLGMYRVLGCTGTTSDDIILAAVMMAMKDQCNVINVSISGLGGWVDGGPLDILFEQLQKRRVVVVVAPGNAGGDGLFMSSFPGSTYSQMTAAAVNTIGLIAFKANIRGHGVVPIRAAKPFNITGLAVYFTSTDPNTIDDACNNLPDTTPNLSNRIVIVQRGTCNFSDKFASILARGGKNILIYNSATAGSLPYDNPAGTGLDHLGGLSRGDGLALLSLYLQSKKTLVMDFPITSLVVGLTDTISGGLVSAYSNYGPTNDMFGQPTLAAPGGNILSTLPLALGGVGFASGTSMAAPFLAGAAAVLMSARKSEVLTTVQVRSILTTTAKALPVSLTNPTTFTSVAQQGGGLVQLADAVKSKTLISPNELLLNDSAYANLNQNIRISNSYSIPITYKFSSSVAQTLGVYTKNGDNLPAPIPPVLSSASASVAFSVSSVTIQPGQSYVLTAKFTPPQLSKEDVGKFPLYSGFINIVSNMGSNSVPYFGLAAALYDMPIFDFTSTVFGPGEALPLLFNPNIGRPQKGLVSYVNTGPVIVSRLAGGTRSISYDLVYANTSFTPTASDPYDSNIGQRDLNVYSSGMRREPRSSIALLYADVPIVGTIIHYSDFSRDYLTQAGDGGAGQPYSNFQMLVDGSYVTPDNRTASTSSTETYRVLIRALKITGDPIFEKNYESWLSPPFTLNNDF